LCQRGQTKIRPQHTKKDSYDKGGVLIPLIALGRRRGATLLSSATVAESFTNSFLLRVCLRDVRDCLRLGDIGYPMVTEDAGFSPEARRSRRPNIKQKPSVESLKIGPTI
jgi:hypothetical protein